MRIFERKCREVINWWTVVLLEVRRNFWPETSRTKRCESDNIARSTFSLIGRRALQMCICHKHNKTHNGNAFHIRNFSLSFLFSVSRSCSLNFHFSVGLASGGYFHHSVRLLSLSPSHLMTSQISSFS